MLIKIQLPTELSTILEPSKQNSMNDDWHMF